MKKISFGGWENCVELQSGDFRLVVTTEVGPRVIGAFLKDSPNLFFVNEATSGAKGGDEWRIYGGHRLWTSPESLPRTYEPDNHEAGFVEDGDAVVFSSGTDPRTGIYKSIKIRPLGENSFELTHKIANNSMWDVELAAWALSVMAPGGTAVVPIPEGDKNSLLPNRYLAIWPYTNMADPRVSWGEKLIMLRQDSGAKTKFKIGINAEDGWLAYLNHGVAFIKNFAHLVDAEYPDNGCSVEVFTNSDMLEVETLSPLYELAPGEEIEHVEIFRAMKSPGKISTEAEFTEFFSALR